MSLRAEYRPEGRPLALHASAFGATFETRHEGAPFTVEGDVAVVEIQGPLVQHRGAQGGMWDSYDEIASRVKSALASPSRAVSIS